MDTEDKMGVPVSFLRVGSPVHASGRSSTHFYAGDGISMSMELISSHSTDYIVVEWKNGRRTCIPMTNVTEFEFKAEEKLTEKSEEKSNDVTVAKRRGRPPKYVRQGDTA